MPDNFHYCFTFRDIILSGISKYYYYIKPWSKKVNGCFGEVSRVFQGYWGVCKYYISTLGVGGGSEGNAYFVYVVRGGWGSRFKMLILLM